MNLGKFISSVSIFSNNLKILYLVPHEKILTIYDSYLDYNDNEFFLVQTSRHPLKWVVKDQIKCDIFNKFIEIKKLEAEERYNKLKTSTCNTDKTTVTSCEIKCKTRGFILLVSNCGITVAFREIYGAESLPQVASLMLDTLDLFKGAYLYTFA
jgi:hypothetical protein